MKTTILKTRDDNGNACFEWLVTDLDGSFVGGGYCRTREQAESDMQVFLSRS